MLLEDRDRFVSKVAGDVDVSLSPRRARQVLDRDPCSHRILVSQHRDSRMEGINCEVHLTPLGENVREL